MFDVLGNKMWINIHCYSYLILQSNYQNKKNKQPSNKTTGLLLAQYELCSCVLHNILYLCRFQRMKNNNFNLINMLKGSNISILPFKHIFKPQKILNEGN